RRHVGDEAVSRTVLPRCQERPVTFSLPSLAAVGNGEIDEPSPQNVSRAMNAVTTALACGEITPGEAATIAVGYETFVRTAGTAREKVARGNLLQFVTAGDDIEDEDEDVGDAEAIDRSRPVDGAARRLPARQFVEGSLFNLEEKSYCRFSADA